MEPNHEFYSQSKKIHGNDFIQEYQMIEKLIVDFKVISKDERLAIHDIFERFNKSSWLRSIVMRELKKELKENELKRNSGMFDLKFEF